VGELKSHENWYFDVLICKKLGIFLIEKLKIGNLGEFYDEDISPKE